MRGGYGGGGGGGGSQGGGGGSSFVTPDGLVTAHGTSDRTGDGQVTIVYDPATDSCGDDATPPVAPPFAGPATLESTPASVTPADPRFTG